MKIIDFYADWCGPCKVMEPTIDELEKEFEVQKINIDEDPETAQKYGIMSIPTIVLELEGKELKRFTGVTNKNTIIQAMGL